jgi:hypothetical protein
MLGADQVNNEDFKQDSQTADTWNACEKCGHRSHSGTSCVNVAPQYRCQRCQKTGTQKELDRFFCSDIPFSCYQAREHMTCTHCENDFDDMNDWTDEPEYDGNPGPGSGVCRECKEKSNAC